MIVIIIKIVKYQLEWVHRIIGICSDTNIIPVLWCQEIIWQLTIDMLDRNIGDLKGIYLMPSDPTYKGSKFNVMIEWENGEVTSEPLSIIGANNLVPYVIYAKENKLLEIDGWKQFRGIAR